MGLRPGLEFPKIGFISSLILEKLIDILDRRNAEFFLCNFGKVFIVHLPSATRPVQSPLRKRNIEPVVRGNSREKLVPSPNSQGARTCGSQRTLQKATAIRRFHIQSLLGWSPAFMK